MQEKAYYSLATLCARLHANGTPPIIKYAKDNYRRAKFGYIICYSMPAAVFGRMSDMSEYFEMGKKICDKWEIPYLDLYFNDALNKVTFIFTVLSNKITKAVADKATAFNFRQNSIEFAVLLVYNGGNKSIR